MIHSNNSLFKFVCRALKPYKIWVALFIMISMLSGLWGIFNAILMKIIINTVQAYDEQSDLMQQMLWPGIWFLINLEVHDLCWRFLTLINYRVQALIKTDIINDAFGYIGKQTHQFFQNTFAGRIASNINILADSLERSLHEISIHVFRIFVLLIGALITMYFVNPVFALGLLVWACFFLGISFGFARKTLRLADEHAATESEVTGGLVDSISNAQSVRLFARNKYEVRYLFRYLRPMQIKFRNKLWFNFLINTCRGVSLLVLLGFMYFALVEFRAHGQLTTGDFALILGLSIDIAWNLWWLIEQLEMLFNELGRAQQCLDRLYQPIAIVDQPQAQDLQVTKGKIEFAQVHFAYPQAEPLFSNKSIVIHPGQKVGLVGYSGGGKTTFVNLILRLYDVDAGQVLIDGQDIKNVTQDSLHQAIGMIPQDPSLFHRSLRENIAYGKLDASDEELITAAERAHAHEFIKLLPEQYESLVGERGIKLSGGQRQRIVIARAMLKNAPILILDEATSQLDSLTEHEIQDSLWQLMQNKTSIVIAHRLSTLLRMDRILVFAKGKIIQDGNHEQLLAKGGLYKTLWDAQVGGFLLDKPEDYN